MRLHEQEKTRNTIEKHKTTVIIMVCFLISAIIAGQSFKEAQRQRQWNEILQKLDLAISARSRVDLIIQNWPWSKTETDHRRSAL